MGFCIDKEGIHPTLRRLELLRKLQCLLILLSLKHTWAYYHIIIILCFIYLVLAPLYQLLHIDVTWHWSEEADTAFLKSKELLTDENVLVHFDSALPLILACDASQYGVGAVLAHRFPDGIERPITFASHTLSDTEKKYSQVEKGLACVFGVKSITVICMVVIFR